MNIGIITFQKANNYGAILQCYALYKYIDNYNLNVEIIDYRNNKIEDCYSIFPKLKKNFLKLSFSYLNSIINYKMIKIKYNKFEEFRQSIVFSRSYTQEDLINLSLDYDLIIAGSDQLWNSDITYGFDDIYYLNFPGKFYRATYAMSMGTTSNPVYAEKKFKEMISNIDYISMRENDAAQYISNLLSKEVPQVLDPTLLLPKNDWINIVKNVALKLPKKYILFYFVEYNPHLKRIAEKLSKDLTIPVVYLNRTLNPKKKLHCKSICKMDAGPLEFVKLIQNAEIVVTSSFHATAFSCIFEKDIHLMTHSTTGSRVVSLAEMFKITDRIYNSYEDFLNKYPNQKNISYSKDSFNNIYKESFEYINKLISLGEKDDQR